MTPFLPGPSLLFASGALAARPGTGVDVGLLYLIFTAGGILGDLVNYLVGRAFGRRMTGFFGKRFEKGANDNVERTERFFNYHGGKTIVLARLIPGIRTLVPLVAGWRHFDMRRFLIFNSAGGLLAVGIFLFAGYFFGGIPAIRKNFALVIVVIGVLSVIPAILEWRRFKPVPETPPPPTDKD